MKFARGKYTKAQREWCEKYEHETGFDPHAMSDYEAGNKTFVQAAKDSVKWFEDWSSDVYLRITRDTIPGDDWLDEDTGEPRVCPRPASHKRPPELPR